MLMFDEGHVVVKDESWRLDLIDGIQATLLDLVSQHMKGIWLDFGLGKVETGRHRPSPNFPLGHGASLHPRRVGTKALPGPPLGH